MWLSNWSKFYSLQMEIKKKSIRLQNKLIARLKFAEWRSTLIEISQENISLWFEKISLWIKPPTLFERKPCIDCFLGDHQNCWKAWPRTNPLESCLCLHYILLFIIAIIIIIVILIFNMITIISSIAIVSQIYFSLVDLD